MSRGAVRGTGISVDRHLDTDHMPASIGLRSHCKLPHRDPVTLGHTSTVITAQLTRTTARIEERARKPQSGAHPISGHRIRVHLTGETSYSDL